MIHPIGLLLWFSGVPNTKEGFIGTPCLGALALRNAPERNLFLLMWLTFEGALSLTLKIDVQEDWDEALLAIGYMGRTLTFGT